MSGPYRDGPPAPEAPLREVLWRRRVGTAATWLFGLLVADFAAGVVFFAANWHAWTAAPTAVRVAFGIAVAIAVWMLTAPRPGARASRLGWLLRAVAMALPLAELAYYLTDYWTLLVVSTVVAQVAGMAYVARLFDAGEDPASARDARLLAVPVAAGPYVLLWLDRPFPTLTDWAFMVTLACMAWAGILLFRLRDMLYVAEGRWWFDNGVGSAGEWVSLLRYFDGYAEVIHADGQRMRFSSRTDGEEWLGQHGYVPAKRAMEEHLVTAMPPDVLPVARRRKRLRAAATSQEPRLRVASEGMADEAADEASDELDDRVPLDEPEPPRAVAADDPHDPRA